MNFFQVAAEKPNIQPSTLFMVGEWPVTSSFLMIVVVLALLVVAVISLRRSMRLVPGGFQNMCEMLYEGMFGLVNQITKNELATKKIFPIIGSLFVFVGISNLIALIPGLTSITFDGKEILRSPTSDFNTTFSLALAMMILVQIESVRDWGILGYIGKYVQVKEVWKGFKKGAGEGMIAVVNFIIGLLDVISEIAKVVSLSVRLFGNIYAGEILMTILLGAFAYALPSVWLGMNIFVGVIQALVFGSLVAAYYVIAQRPKEDSERS